MKIRIILAILSILIFTSCAGTGKATAPQNTKLSRLEAEQVNPVNGLEILTSKTQLNRGDNGIIVMKGKAGVTYSITASYKAGGKLLTATEYETAAPDGIVTWNWFVAPGTSPGVYPVEIKGGGETLRTTYTVNQ